MAWGVTASKGIQRHLSLSFELLLQETIRPETSLLKVPAEPCHLLPALLPGLLQTAICIFTFCRNLCDFCMGNMGENILLLPHSLVLSGDSASPQSLLPVDFQDTWGRCCTQ